MHKTTKVTFYLLTLQWQKHLPAARPVAIKLCFIFPADLLTAWTYISSFISWQQLKPQPPKTKPSWLLLWKFHIFFRGMHNEVSKGCEIIFANNLYFPCTHPRHVFFPWNAVSHYKSHTQLPSCSITISPFNHNSHWRADGSGDWKHPEGASWLEQASMQSLSHMCRPDGRTRDIPKPDPLLPLLVSLVQKTLTICKGAREAKLGQQNEPRAGVPQHPSDLVIAKLQPVLGDSVLAQQGSQQSAPVC